MKFTQALGKTTALLSLILIAGSAYGHWTLDNDASQLSFVTVKADNVGEVHTFDLMSGEIEDSGELSITVELASVNTLIPIRNERMQAMLFETSVFPEANISASVDIDALGDMDAGDSRSMQVEFQLSLHGNTNSYTADVMVVRLEGGLMATTTKPIIINADSYQLAQGVEALREVAGLPRISNAVPVSFTVVFEGGH